MEKMIGLEIVKILLLFAIALEGAFILFDKDTKEEETHSSRRTVYGTFKNPLGDSYRKNSKGQLKPVYPGGRMIDHLGDDEDEI